MLGMLRLHDADVTDTGACCGKVTVEQYKLATGRSNMADHNSMMAPERQCAQTCCKGYAIVGGGGFAVTLVAASSAA